MAFSRRVAVLPVRMEGEGSSISAILRAVTRYFQSFVRSSKKLTFCNPMLKTKYGTFHNFWNCFGTGVREDFAFEGTPPMAQWRKAFCVQLGFLWKKIHQVQTVNYCFEALLKLDLPGLMNCRGIGALTLGKNGSNVLSARRSS